MKKILFFIGLVLLSIFGYSQSTLPLRADTIRMYKQGGLAHLKLETANKDSTGGVFYNLGGGVVGIKKSYKINDSTFVVGGDTISISLAGSGGGGGSVLAENGTQIVSSKVRLGGTLLAHTTVSGDGRDYDLIFDSIRNFKVQRANQVTIMSSQGTMYLDDGTSGYSYFGRYPTDGYFLLTNGGIGVSKFSLADSKGANFSLYNSDSSARIQGWHIKIGDPFQGQNISFLPYLNNANKDSALRVNASGLLEQYRQTDFGWTVRTGFDSLIWDKSAYELQAKALNITINGSGPTKTITDSTILYDFTVAGGGTVESENSVTGDGSSGTKLKLVNDAATPGSDKLYGTNYAGTKGYRDPNSDAYNIVVAGADNTGTTDVSTYITAAVTAGRKNIYLPAGTFLISSQIQVADSVTISGAGRSKTFIKLASNITAFKLNYSLGGNKAQFKDFSFRGTYGGAGTTSQKGIVIDSAYGVMIHNIGGYFMAGFVVSIGNNGLLATNKYTFGNTVSNCYFETCYGGVLLDTRGEYNLVTATTAVDGTYGVYVTGGNNRITNNNLSTNSYNFYLTGGSNNAHGTVTGNTINHANTANVYVTGVTLGMDFVGNEIYAGAISLLTSDGINFNGGTIEVTTITVTNCTNTNFFGTRFSAEPTWTITGNAPGVYRLNEGSTDGFVIRDVKNNKNTEFWQSNSVMNFAKASGSTTTQFTFWKPIVGATGSFDASRDLSVGKARFDLGSTSGDGVQVYKSGSSGSAFAILDNAANYMQRSMPGGLTSFGNNSTPTAVVDITGQGATAAALRINSQTTPSAPNNGDIWVNSNHLYVRLNGVTNQLDAQAVGTLQTVTTAGATTNVNVTFQGTGASITANSGTSGIVASGTNFGGEFTSISTALLVSTTSTANDARSTIFQRSAAYTGAADDELQLGFSLRNAAGTSKEVALFSTVMSTATAGAENGSFRILLMRAGASPVKTTEFFANGATGIFNGTAPSASVTDGTLLYSEDVAASSELKVRDEANNITVLSPHNFTGIPQGRSNPLAWAYYSEKDGQYINVDMYKLAQLVEKLTGEKLIYTGMTDKKPNLLNK